MWGCGSVCVSVYVCLGTSTVKPKLESTRRTGEILDGVGVKGTGLCFIKYDRLYKIIPKKEQFKGKEDR